MTAVAQVAVRELIKLAEYDAFHLKFYIPNVGNVYSGVESFPEREKRQHAVVLPPNGRKVVENLDSVGVSRLWAQLVESGFVFYEAFRERWQKEGRVVTLVFCRPECIDGDIATLHSSALVAVSTLLGRVFSYAHVMENPDRSVSLLLIAPRAVGQNPTYIMSAKRGRFSILRPG